MNETWEALADDSAPLNDPTFTPERPPIAGEVPDVVTLWGAASQVRWFARFGQSLRPRKHDDWNEWHCESVEHKGKCCLSCIEDKYQGYGDDIEGCCCRAESTQPRRPPSTVAPRRPAPAGKPGHVVTGARTEASA